MHVCLLIYIEKFRPNNAEKTGPFFCNDDWKFNETAISVCLNLFRKSKYFFILDFHINNIISGY